MRTTIARVLCGLVALMFIYNGLLYMFAPEMQLASTMIEPTGDGIFGMSNIRANIGAPMVTFGILFAMGGWLAEKVPLRVNIIFLMLAIISRIAGIISRGVDPEIFSIRIIIVLSVFLAVAIFGHQTFGDRHAKE
ncbi:MAG: DUF4345 family protein [Chloroflexota bacterium]